MFLGQTPGSGKTDYGFQGPLINLTPQIAKNVLLF